MLINDKQYARKHKERRFGDLRTKSLFVLKIKRTNVSSKDVFSLTLQRI